MSKGRQVTSFHLFTFFALALLVISSCTVPRRYPKYKPFVYSTSISVNGDVARKDRQSLRDGLYNQIDDSLKVRTVLAVRAVPPFFYNRLSKPPVFDSLHIARSRGFMTALLQAQGYFTPVISDTFRIDTVNDQYRVYIDFNVRPGSPTTLDSVGFDLQTPELQELAAENKDKSLLKPRDRYSLQNVSGELDRLLNIYRNNGYYRITKEDIYAEHDTVVAALIDPTLDPFEQLALLDSLQQRRRNPTIDVVVKQRLIKDSSHLQKYHIGNVTVYPDLNLLRDTVRLQRYSSVVNGYQFYHNTRKFKLPFIARNIAFKSGDLYSNDDYFKTINTITNLGAWQQVDIDFQERADSSHILDATIQLFPARKHSLNIDFETSRNVVNVVNIGSFFGLGLNLGVTNRNGFRESIQTSTNARFGVELGPSFIQTVQTSISHNIYIPRFVLPFRINNPNIVAPRTIANISASYTNRRTFFDVRSLNASWGYEWSKRNKTWQLILLNTDLTDVGGSDSLTNVFKRYPAFRFSFQNGLTIGQIATYGTTWTRGQNRTFFRARVEQSGALLGMIKNFDRKDLQRFVRADAEYKYFISRPASTWAFRVFGGYGYSYGLAGDTSEYVLPFFKAYSAGGPYSMRAWRVRQLGLGSNTKLDTLSITFGDIIFETNVEYRFDIGRVFGIKLESALFTDIGNVWLRNVRHDTTLRGAEFRFDKMFRELAVGAGTSLRLDFDFFLIRFDWAYKIKNPQLAEGDAGWLKDLRLKSGQFQLGIGYPF